MKHWKVKDRFADAMVLLGDQAAIQNTSSRQQDYIGVELNATTRRMKDNSGHAFPAASTINPANHAGALNNIYSEGLGLPEEDALDTKSGYRWWQRRNLKDLYT
jgi:hypothetical protein